jgi:hypothetical protein
MAMRLDKSAELTMLHSIQDELDSQEEWTTRRSKLGVLLLAVGAVSVMIFLGPHLPGYAILSTAVKSLLAAIW